MSKVESSGMWRFLVATALTLGSVVTQQPAAEGVASNAQRIEGAKEFAINEPEKLGEEAFAVIEKGLADIDPRVQVNYIYALQRLGRAWGLFVDRREQVVGLNFPDRVPDSLAQRVKELIAHDDETLAIQAALAYALTNKHTETLEIYMVGVLDRFNHSTVQRQLVSLMTSQGMRTPQLQDWVLERIHSAPAVQAIELTSAYVKVEDLRSDLLPELVRLAGTLENYCDYNMLQLIKRYGKRAEPYLSELKRLQEYLEAQLLLPDSVRDVEMYGTGPLSRDLLNEIILEIED